MSAPRTTRPNGSECRPFQAFPALTAWLASFAAVANLLAADEQPAPALPPPEVVQVEIPFQPGPPPGDNNGPSGDFFAPPPGDFGPPPSESDTNADEGKTPSRPDGAAGYTNAPGAPPPRPPTGAAPGNSGNLTAKTDELASTNTPAQVQTNAPATADANPAATAADGPTEPKLPTSTSATNRVDYSRFKIIADRNIFDPNRYPRMARDPRREQRRAPTVEAFSLVGIMVYAKGPFAFFDGSSSSYRKVLKLSDKIAGYEITNVTPDKVQLVADGKTIDLQVGMQMRREEAGPWTVSSLASSYASSSETATAATSSSTSSSSASSGGDESEILKRLMQKREQELNK